MTAYGRASGEIADLNCVVEIHSINRKGLDIHIFAPKELLCFDIDIRKLIGEKISRGQITVRIIFKQDGASLEGSSYYLDHLKQLKEKWELIASGLGFSKNVIDLPFLAGQMQTFTAPDLSKGGEAVQEALNAILEQALQDFMKMKLTEGKNIAKDVESRLQQIKEDLAKVGERSANAPAKYRDKLKEKLEEALQVKTLEDERLLREVALFAEKVDITEEITRLSSHLQQGFGLLKSQEKSVGRVFDFLIQEMLREVNTIASKSSDLEIANLTISMKSEIEKIREQIQNVE